MYESMLAFVQTAKGEFLSRIQALMISSDVSSTPLPLLVYTGTLDSPTTLLPRVSLLALHS
jgi:hypothetical protein